MQGPDPLFSPASSSIPTKDRERGKGGCDAGAGGWLKEGDRAGAGLVLGRSPPTGPAHQVAPTALRSPLLVGQLSVPPHTRSQLTISLCFGETDTGEEEGTGCWEGHGAGCRPRARGSQRGTAMAGVPGRPGPAQELSWDGPQMTPGRGQSAGCEESTARGQRGPFCSVPQTRPHSGGGWHSMAFLWGVVYGSGGQGFGWLGTEGAKASGSVEPSLGSGETEASVATGQ